MVQDDKKHHVRTSQKEIHMIICRKYVSKKNVKKLFSVRYGIMNKGKSLRISTEVTCGIVAMLVIAAICFTPWGKASAMETSDLGVTIDGESVAFQSGYGEPFIDTNSRTLVPLRGVMEAFGAEVSWDNDTSTAIVLKDGTAVQVPIGQTYILVNGVSVANDTSAVIKEERTYLPIRAVLEAFGAGVSWDNENRTVAVRTDGTVTEIPAEPSRGQNPIRNGEFDAMWISYL